MSTREGASGVSSVSRKIRSPPGKKSRSERDTWLFKTRQKEMAGKDLLQRPVSASIGGGGVGMRAISFVGGCRKRWGWKKKGERGGDRRETNLLHGKKEKTGGV